MPNKELVSFIKEARKRGYEDYELRSLLLKKGWPKQEVESAFESLKPDKEYYDRISVSLSSEIIKNLEKRAKKNLLSLEEQVEDILRRSVVSMKNQKTIGQEKIDDALVALFSRKTRKTFKK